jgi:hypothetical protein
MLDLVNKSCYCSNCLGKEERNYICKIVITEHSDIALSSLITRKYNKSKLDLMFNSYIGFCLWLNIYVGKFHVPSYFCRLRCATQPFFQR